MTITMQAQTGTHDVADHDPISSYFITQDLIKSSQMSVYSDLIEQLERKQSKQKNQLKFLRTIFYKTHNKLLLNYDKLASLDQTIEKGTYGCLTGTMLYALILDHFKIAYEIIELPNHVFLQIKLDDKIVLFESTMPIDGFIIADHKIEERINTKMIPSEIPLTTIGQKNHANWMNEPYIKKISLKELNALQYFNESIKKYLEKQYMQSIDHSVEAYSMYPNARNKMLMQLILNKIRHLKTNSIEEHDQYLVSFKICLAKRGLSGVLENSLF